MENNAFYVALSLLMNLDATLFQIVALSLQVSLLAVLAAALLGFPPVVAGLTVYLLLSRAGPLGELGLLFTPTAMVIAQFVLVLPILAALSRQKVEELLSEYREQFISLGMSRSRMMPTLLWDARFTLLTVLLAGFGRASAEVGAVMMVGGNIDGVTRVMTTAIVLETSKGDLPLALGLGIVLLTLVMLINAGAYVVSELAKRRVG